MMDERAYIDLPSAAKHMQEIVERMQQRKPFFFLDYDGTLTPIVRRPEDAILSDDMRLTLHELAKAYQVAIVSGRDRQDVQSLVGIQGLIYAGSHGFDISGPDGLKLQNEQGMEALPDLNAAESRLQQKISGFRGAQVERKKYSIAVHYRNASEQDVAKIEAVVDQVTSEYSSLRKNSGKKIYELQPDIQWDKGRAVIWLLRRLDSDEDNPLPIYLGDDLTDENAFRALQGIGIGILVGDHGAPSSAHYRLSDTHAVKLFLQAVIEKG